ncbi:MAG: hypothetical protein AAF918_02855 [Pseudomonadota bacterium]
MARSVLLIFVGVLLGGGAVLWRTGSLGAADPVARLLRPQTEASTTAPTVAARASSVAPDAVAAEARSMASLAEIDGDFAQTLALYQLIATDDADALLARLAALPAGLSQSDSEAAASIVLARLAEFDPDRALRYILERPGLSQRRWISTVFDIWGKRDLAAGQAAALDLVPTLRTIAGAALLRSRSDLSAAQREAIAAELSLSRLPLSPGADLALAWSQAESVRQPELRRSQRQEILSAWATTDPEAAWAALRASPDRTDRARLAYQLFDTWARLDPAAAVDALANDSTIPRRNALLMSTMQVYADQDLEAAQMRLDSLEPSVQLQARIGFVAPLARQSVDRALAWIQEGNGIQGRAQGYMMLINTLVKEPTTVDFPWIDELPKQDAQVVQSTLVRTLSRRDPERARDYVDTLQNAELRQQAVPMLANAWAGYDPEVAARWVDTLPTDERALATPTLLVAWARSDFEAAERYRNSFASARERERGAVELLQAAPSADAVEALLNDVASDEFRPRAVVTAYSRLRRLDPARAAVFKDEFDELRDTTSQSAALLNTGG